MRWNKCRRGAVRHERVVLASVLRHSRQEASGEGASTVHRLVKRHGLALQYSVFYLEMTNAEVGRLLGKLEELIDERVDDVRVYAISRFEDIQMLGESLLPEGVQLFSQGRKLG